MKIRPHKFTSVVTRLALDPVGPEHEEINKRGFHVLMDGQELPL